MSAREGCFCRKAFVPIHEIFEYFIFGFRQDYDYPYADTAKTLLNDIFNLAEHNRSFVPRPFNVISSSGTIRA